MRISDIANFTHLDNKMKKLNNHLINCENYLSPWICAIIHELSKVCNVNRKVGERYLFSQYYSILVKSPI